MPKTKSNTASNGKVVASNPPKLADAPRQYVLVEAIQQYRMRYVVELDNQDPAEWALDTVVMGETKELSQLDLGETIVSHRVLAGGIEEAIAMARADNAVGTESWPDTLVAQNHITPLRSP